MALNAAIVWEVRTTGADTNGGGFKTGATGTDWSQQNAAQYAVTDGVTAGTTTITSITANFGTDVVGNVIYVAGGTGSVAAGWYEIISRTNSTTIVVDRSTGLTAGTGVTLNIGGALASPGQASALGVDGNKYYIKAGTYTITSATPNIAGGCFKPQLGGNGTFLYIEGYQTTRGDLGTKPVLILNTGVSTATIVDLTTSTYGRCLNLEVDGHSEATSRGFSFGGSFVYLARCLARNCTNSGIHGANATAEVVHCRATGCSTQEAFHGESAGIRFRYCQADTNTTKGFGGTAYTAEWCLSFANSGASSDGFYTSVRAVVVNCSTYGNGRSGFHSGTGNVHAWTNCIAEGNAGYGFDSDGAAGTNPRLINCAGYNNTSGNYSTTTYPTSLIENFLALSASPYTNAGVADFSLNNTVGGGASVRAAAYPGAFPGGTTTSYADIGAVQHADPASSGPRRHPGMAGGCSA